MSQANLGRYLLLRCTRAVLTAFGVVSLVFLLIRMVPGDPVDAILGDTASPEERAQLRENLHLDASWARQFGHFVGDVANGSLGRSFRNQGRTVASLIQEVFPSTVVLSLAALGVAWLVALPLGTLAAARQNQWSDRIASLVALTGLALPTIWLGPLLILVFGVELAWLPLPGDDPDRPIALLLPAVTIGSALAAILTRQTRAAMLEVLSQPFIAAARARGIPEWRILMRHALRNAMLPVLTVGAAQLGALLSGAVIVEKIFERPGLGNLFLDAFFARDIPVVQGCVLVVGLLYVSVNLVLDLVYGLVDPRVKLQ